ncbi:hypothetical protein PR003_g3957 [Phytophthora rubi]|uniref:AGC protein kinase n=1 Tax=Phytophthora rubi TaxID=129364 RepID=A0A6A4FXA1_9STRA|nr:hypothetical protein PR003_g3957 [Phytophthora rubi]
MKKSPVAAMSNIREAVRRKSVGLSFTTNFSIFSRSASSTGEDSEHGAGEDGDDFNDELDSSQYNRSREDSAPGEDDPDSSPSPAVSSRNSYVEPPEPPLPPPGGLLEAATKNVQGKMQTLMETFHEVTTSHDDETIQCSVFLSRTALFSDRLVVFVGDSDGSPAGIWSARLCVRSGSEGGGIFKGSLGSMLPYIMKAKEDKLGIVLFDDIFKDSMRSGEIDMRSAVQRFMTGWRNHVLTSRATHVFIVGYRDGGNLVVEVLRAHMKEMQRHISGVAFVQSTHHISSDDSYTLRKMIAQWCIAYMSSPEGVQALKRMKSKETPLGCVVLSAGRVNSDVDLLQVVVSSVYASFKARWSGFRVKNVNSGMEKACYLCKGVFNMRRWRRHCLRTGEKESVFSGSAKPGKMSVNDFELVTVIGRGACGKVLLVLKKDGADAGHLYAMKVLKKEWVMNKDLVTQTMAERRILQEANHPYIVQLKYAFQNQDKLYMVMEYYSGGSLRQVLRRRGRFSIKRARFYLAEILLAIAHLHASNILYRDLKLENIVITADGNVACTDFGLSKEEMDDNERTSSFVGTCEYLAPELIMKEGYGKAVDWWALGILAYEMVQGDSPFRHNVPTILFDKILKEEPEFSDRFTPEAQDLIMSLLTKDPEHRLGCGPEGVEEIKQHPFFAEIDWDMLLRMEMEVPRPPHRMEDVTDESHLSRAIAKMREAREEIMPDSPVSLPSSPSEQKHFDRFSYQGLGDWKPEMADMEFDEETGDFKQETIHEDEEFEEEAYAEESGDGEGVPLSPGSKQSSMTSSKASPSKANGSDTPPASSSAASASPRSPQSVGSPPPAPMSPGSPVEGSVPTTPVEPESQII